jgi:hypothetical protein
VQEALVAAQEHQLMLLAALQQAARRRRQAKATQAVADKTPALIQPVAVAVLARLAAMVQVLLVAMAVMDQRLQFQVLPLRMLAAAAVQLGQVRLVLADLAAAAQRALRVMVTQELLIRAAEEAAAAVFLALEALVGQVLSSSVIQTFTQMRHPQLDRPRSPTRAATKFTPSPAVGASPSNGKLRAA